MSYTFLKKATIISIVVFCFLLVTAAIWYAFSDTVSQTIYDLIGLTIAYAIVFGLHFWSTSYSSVTGFQKMLLAVLNIEIFLTLITLIPLIFGWFDFIKTIMLFVAIQLVHGAIYLCNMFLYDEKPIQKTTLSEQEILQKSQPKSINPAFQEYDGSGNQGN